MSDDDDNGILWHTGLFARLDSSFPKKCMNCGRVFENSEQYFTETEDINDRDRGIKPYVDDGTATIVEAFRNCPCGSTLMETFDDHREESNANIARDNKPSAPAPSTGSSHLDSALEENLGAEFTDLFADEPGPWGDAWYLGLRPNAGEAFPKKCRNCGRVYETPDEFFRETGGTHDDRTGLKEFADDDAGTCVEAYRNCSCGSTLMDVFSNRRDTSPAGQVRREKFDELLTFLIKAGLDPESARTELLKIARGRKSAVLSQIRPPGQRGTK